MGTIKQATYGDENSSTDITESLVKMFRPNKYIDVKVGPQLLETREAGPATKLNQAEKDEIRKQAEQSCGNALDDDCMKSTQESLKASKLQEKSREEASKPIVGERLTVTVVDARGKDKKLVIPKDHPFRFGNAGKASDNELTKAYDEFQKAFTFEKLGSLFGTFLFYFIWVFGTVFTWVALGKSFTLPDGKVINPGDYTWLKYVGTGIAVATAGYGGFSVVLLVWMILGAKHYMIERSLLLSKQ